MSYKRKLTHLIFKNRLTIHYQYNVINNNTLKYLNHIEVPLIGTLGQLKSYDKIRGTSVPLN